MAHSEDGQYELVLENKQVLGIFFAAAILCGIFFGLGFLVGRSSKGNAPSVIPSATVPDGKSGTKRQSAMTGPDRPADTPAETPVAEKPADKPADKPVDKPADPPPAAEKPKQEDKPKAEEKAAPPAAPPAADGVVNLQVAAFSTKDEAEPMAALLKRKNFPVTVIPGASDRLFHVMVGPFANAKAADDTKKKLEGEGFKPIIKR